MSKYCLCRVVGNELPPKDKEGDKLKALKFVVEKDKEINAEKKWLINRIIDPIYEEQVKNILKNQDVTIIPFVEKEYNNALNKMHYLTNINNARNNLIQKNKQYDYIFSLDQNCFFLPQQWISVINFIHKNNKKYYGLTSKRITTLDEIEDVPDNELMIIFTKESTLFFDENICFSQNDKRELLNRLGYRGKWEINSSAECATAGYVTHIGYDYLIANNTDHRMKMRELGLHNLIERANKIVNKIKFI